MWKDAEVTDVFAAIKLRGDWSTTYYFFINADLVSKQPLAAPTSFAPGINAAREGSSDPKL